MLLLSSDRSTYFIILNFVLDIVLVIWHTQIRGEIQEKKLSLLRTAILEFDVVENLKFLYI